MTSPPPIPDEETLYRAFADRDRSFDGSFVAAVRTTGIFCRPGCPARTPKRENVEFFPAASAALEAGYRPCRRCRPLDPPGAAPGWLRPLLEAVAAEPDRRWTTAEVRAFGLDPDRVRRWFKAQRDTTFAAYLRDQRLGRALHRLREGRPLEETSAAADFESLSGFCAALRRRTGKGPRAAAAEHQASVLEMETPLGPLLIAADETVVHLVEFRDRIRLEASFAALERRLDMRFYPGFTPPGRAMKAELEAYFDGRLRSFQTPVALSGSVHERQVWEALRAIPYAATWSYAELARVLGQPRGARAVAAAVARNRLAVVLPCHRVVGADGSLTGYAGGLWRKRALLELERSGQEKA